MTPVHSAAIETNIIYAHNQRIVPGEQSSSKGKQNNKLFYHIASYQKTLYLKHCNLTEKCK